MTSCLLGGFAVMFFSFSKDGKSTDRKSDFRNLFAFFLASSAVIGLLVGMILLAPVSHRPFVHVQIQTNGDTHDIVAAIQSLHRTDVKIKTLPESEIFSPGVLFGAVIGWMMLTGLTLFFYKTICRWMGIPPEI